MQRFQQKTHIGILLHQKPALNPIPQACAFLWCIIDAISRVVDYV